ncbi:MAG: hypothetical protein HDQ87_05455 [Clostridia bacterium]|nr:hypothetical protein [Clostridia bacterium]
MNEKKLTLAARAEADIRGRICFIMQGRMSANHLPPGWQEHLTERDRANARLIVKADKDVSCWIAARVRKTVVFADGWFTQVKEESYRLAPDMFAAKEAQSWLWENRKKADDLLIEFLRAVALADEISIGGLRQVNPLAELEAEFGAAY